MERYSLEMDYPGEKERIIKIELEDADRLFNPFYKLKGLSVSLYFFPCHDSENFSLSGFDGTKDTPVESLHVFLLGCVEYLVTDFMQSMKDKVKQIEANWMAFNIQSLNIGYIKPQYLVKQYVSLIVKDYKIILQAAPFVYFPLMNEEKRNLWFSLCYLGSNIFQTKITDMDSLKR
jgi:hypothetical protein